MPQRAETAQEIYQKDKKSERPQQKLVFNFQPNLLIILIISIMAGGLAGYLASSYYNNQSYLPSDLNKQTIDFTKKIKIDSPEAMVIDRLAQQIVGVYEIKKSGEWWQKTQFKGTALVVTSDGWLITTPAVINDWQKEYQVITANNNYYLAKNFSQDKLTGLVFFKIEATNLTPVQFVDSQQLLAAQEVIILAKSSQASQPQIKFSNIEQLKYNLIKSPKDFYHSTELQDEFIYLNDSLTNDFNGSLVANLNGEVIGLGNNLEQTEYFQTTIPANYLRQAINKFLPTKTQVTRSYLGLDYLNLSQNLNLPANFTADKKSGALILSNKELGITAIKKDSPAKNILREGDIILKVNEQEIDEDNNFTELIQNYNPGDKIKLLIFRAGEEKEVEITLE